MQPEGTGYVVVLAVNVVGNRSTHSYVFGARADRQKPPARHGEIKDLRQGDAGFATQQAGFRIKRDQPIEIRCAQQGSMLQQTNVTVTAPHTHGEYFRVRRNGCREIFLPEKGANFSEDFWKAAPGFKLRPDLTRGHRILLESGVGGDHHS